MKKQPTIQLTIAARLHETMDAVVNEEEAGYHIIDIMGVPMHIMPENLRGTTGRDIILMLLSNDTQIYQCVVWGSDEMVAAKITETGNAIIAHAEGNLPEIREALAGVVEHLLFRETREAQATLDIVRETFAEKAEEFRNNPETWG